MKKNILIAIIGVMLFTTISCQKFLESEIKTEIDIEKFGNTPKEVSFFLNQAYSELRLENNNYYYKNFTTDYTTPPGPFAGNNTMVDINFDATAPEAIAIWGTHYGTIAKTNLVIQKCLSGLDKNPTTADKVAWNKIIAQAKFIRAYLYFDLVRIFRNVPIIDIYFTSFEQIENVTNLKADQMKVQELKVYDFIIADIDAALQTPEMLDIDDRGRAGKLAVEMLKAKVYLNLASIEKFRDLAGNGTDHYTKALTSLNTIINSGKFSLKTYFPDNFIRDKQHIGNPETIFWLEYNATDNFFPRASPSTGFAENSVLNLQDFGLIANFATQQYANDFGISAFDFNSPGDIVRRFWTMESGGTFQDLDVNGDGVFNNKKPDAPYGPNSEIFLVTTDPYQYTRPYWFEIINDATKTFRSRPAVGDIVPTGPNGPHFIVNWNANNTGLPTMRVVKYRRNPLVSANYTDANYDADVPVYRYADVLLMYAEIANELVGPTAKPNGGAFTALEAVNQVRNRARNFVYIPNLTIASKIIENSPYTATYGDIFRRVATRAVGNGPFRPPLTANATDTLRKYYEQISAFRGIREVTPVPTIRNFKEFPNTQNFVADFTTTNPSVLRNLLLDERWRELAFEFNTRWFDLTRMGSLLDRVQMTKTTINPLTRRNLSETYVGTSVLLNFDPKYMYFPIPQEEIARNPKLNQNKGY